MEKVNILLNQLTDTFGPVEELVFGNDYIHITFADRIEPQDLTMVQLLREFGLTEFQLDGRWDGYFIDLPPYGQY